MPELDLSPPPIDPSTAPAAAVHPSAMAKRIFGSDTTQQRLAVDAMAQGHYDVALQLYRQLAAAEPRTDAFRAAARILEEAKASREEAERLNSQVLER